jgi:hypothetical protein
VRIAHTGLAAAVVDDRVLADGRQRLALVLELGDHRRGGSLATAADEATWIRGPAAAEAGSAATLDWRGVQTPTDLEQWSEGRGLDVFFPALLDSGDVRFYGTGSVDGAGFALNRSGGVVGVSNVFAGSADLITVWSDLVVVAARTYPGFDLVGYELGADLQAALAVGFAGIGQLRVWMR